MRRRRSPRVNSILSQEQEPEMVLPLVDLCVSYCKIMNSFLYISVTTCNGEYARSLQNDDSVLGFISFLVSLPPSEKFT